MIELILYVLLWLMFVEDSCDCFWIVDEIGDDVVFEIDVCFWEFFELDVVVVFLKEFLMLIVCYYVGMSVILWLVCLVLYGFYVSVSRFARL